MDEIIKREDALFENISKLIDEARKHVKTTVNTVMVYTYYGVGKYIIEDEQQGEKRAAYGKAVLKNLSIRLTDKYGKGWSVATLKNAKKFYSVYSEKTNCVCSIENKKAKHCLANSMHEAENLNARNTENIPRSLFALSWSHYLTPIN